MVIAIVGGGIAGLYCGYLLRKAGLEVVILESNSQIGGRVRSVEGFVDWKRVDLGAEFIHGKKSLLKDIIDREGWPNRLLFTWAQGDGQHPKGDMGKELSMYYFGGLEKKLIRYDCIDPELKRLNETLGNLNEISPKKNDRRTLEQYLIDEGFSVRELALADAGYANSLCATIDRLGLYEVSALEAAWEAHGAGDYRLENSTSQLVEFFASGLDIRTNWIVKKVDYTKHRTIQIIGQDNQILLASFVVVTVPVTVLQRGLIEFIPSLPSNKQHAIQSLAIDNAVKIIMKFSKNFWPKELNGVSFTLASTVPNDFLEIRKKLLMERLYAPIVLYRKFGLSIRIELAY